VESVPGQALAAGTRQARGEVWTDEGEEPDRVFFISHVPRWQDAGIIDYFYSHMERNTEEQYAEAALALMPHFSLRPPDV
jgi:hypothetical protein